ncbi:hypothetical protein [Dyella sp. ASV21]|jgi:hypothetical protein|uniref:hypothetical protein n=1 Tax=Dyella sp. ASV21 TaxID=2795114 RepID=UPI0018EB98A8|nr:hypothetical protein [Dyella sp. ASV21]
MKTAFRRLSLDLRWRHVLLLVSALLFAAAIYKLMLGAGADAGIWRGVALSALYLGFCLTQRRLFTPSSRHYAEPLPRERLLK